MSRQAVTLEKKYRKDYSQFFIFLIPMIFLVIFMLYPMVNTFIRSFWVSSEDLSFHGFTLDNFKQFITSNLYKKSLKNSLIVSVSVMLLSLLIGVPMGYCVARVKMPGKNLILSLGILPIIMPSFVGAFTWIILLGNKGIVRYVLNLVLGPLGIQLPSIYGMAGMIFCMTMTYYPFVFQLSYGAFASANSLLEESAMLMGASRSRIMRTITLPLIMPSIGAGALLVFVRAIGNFGIPAMIGGDTYVLPTLIYFEVNGFWNMNGASAIAVVNVLITVFILWFQKYIVSRHEYETISATHTELKQHESLGARILAIVFCAIILIFSLLPQITIIIMSFFKKWVGLLPTGFTLENYTRIPSYSSHELFNSFFLSITATLLCAIIGSIIAYITERKKPKGAALLEISVMAPFILPGTVVSIALLSAFSGNSIIRLTGTYAIIIISYIIRRSPYVYRSVAAQLTQLNPSLEEASTIMGSSWFRTFRKVSLPLIMPAVISGSILTLTTLLQELSTTILLYSGKTRTVPIQIYAAVQDGKLGSASALSVILLVAVFLIVFFTNRKKGSGGLADSFKLG